MSEETRTEGSLTARAFWLVFAKTLAFAFGFVLPMLLVRRLSQKEYGLYKQAFLVVGTAASILPLSFGLSAFYFLPRERERRGAVVLNVMLFNLAVGGAALLALTLRPGLLGAIFNSPELVPYAPLVGLLTLLWIISYFVEVVAVANNESRVSTIFIIVAQLTKTALLLGATVFYTTVGALLVAAVVQGLLQTGALLVYLRSRFGAFWRDFDWPVMRRQLAYALPFGSAAILYVVLTDLHNYFVSYRFGEEAFALYAVGCFSLPLVGIIMESVGSLMVSRVSQLQSAGDRRGIITVTAGAMRKLSAIYFPLYALLLVTGPELIAFLFTDRYRASWPVFAINLTALPFNILVSDPILRAHAQHRYYLLKVRAVTLPVLFGALWLGTTYFGLVGAITAMVSVNILDKLIEAFKAWSIVGVTRRDAVLLKDVGKVAAASAAAGGVAAGVRMLLAGAHPFVVLAVCGAAFSCVYLALVWLLRVPTPQERGALRGKIEGALRLVWWGRASEPLV